MIPITLGAVLRCVAAFVLYIVWPGLIIISVFHSRDRHFHVLEVLSLGLGWSAAFNSVVVYGVHLAGGTLAHYGWVVMLFNILGSIFVFLRYLNEPTRTFWPEIKPRLITVLLVVISLAWFGVILQNGPLVTYNWDQWFHIAHAREALESNRIVPSNPLWEDVSLSETYGAWHPLLAGVARMSGADLVVVWRVGNAFMAGAAVIVMYVVAKWIVEDSVASLFAAVIFLASGVGAQQIMRTFIYPWGIAYFCMWMGLGLFFRYLKTDEEKWMLSAAILGLTPIAIHPQEFIFFCFSVFVLGAGVLLVRCFSGQWVADIKKTLRFFLILILIGLPLVLIKYPTRATLNFEVSATKEDSVVDSILYTSSLARILAGAFPYFEKSGALIYAVGAFNLLTLLFLRFLPQSLDPKVRWFLITMTCAPFLFAIVPGFSWLSTLVLRETYAWRLLNLVPTPMVLALVIMSWLNVPRNRVFLSNGEKKVRNHWHWIHFGLAIGLIAVVGFAIFLIVRRNDLLPTEVNVSPLEHRDMYKALDQVSSEPIVVLSDPRTSYAIPALTKHYVVLNKPSHGSRDDIVTRFADTRSLLSSSVQTRAAAEDVLRRYDVDYILVNKSWLDDRFFTMTRFYSEYTLDFLQGNPTCFVLAYRDSTFELFEVTDECESAELAYKGEPRQEKINSDAVEYLIERRLSTSLSLLGFSLPEAEEVMPGHMVPIDLYWRAEQRIEEPYFIILELLGDYQGRERPWGIAVRKCQEWVQGVKFLVRAVDWFSVPASGLDPGVIFVQSFELEMPSTFTSGPSDLRVYVLSREQALTDQRILPLYLLESEYVYPGVRLRKFESTD